MDTLDQIRLVLIYLENLAGIILNTGTFTVIKFILGVYSLVVVIDVILLLYQRGREADARENKFGMNVSPELVSNSARKGLRKRWEKIRKRIEIGDEKEIKLAILEADEIIEKLIRGMGYSDGRNFGEILDNIPPGQVEDASSIKEAHEVRNKIILEDDFRLSKEEAVNILKLFEKLLVTYMVLED